MKYKTELDIHKEDFDTYQEYNRERMRLINKKAQRETRRERFAELLKAVREFEKEGYTDNEISSKLADSYGYKLVVNWGEGNK